MTSVNTSSENPVISDSLQRTQQIEWNKLADNARLKTALLEELIQNHIESLDNDCPDYLLGATAILSEIKEEIQEVSNYCSAADSYIFNTRRLFENSAS